jgi:two-component system, sensor histidine kinase and response regulator
LMMLSSANRREDAARCEELHVSSYLTKPVRQSTLLDAIMTALGPSLNHEDGRGTETAPLPGGAARPLSLLLAEDNKVNQRLAVSLLEKRGHRVVVVGNGREALAALDGQTFDAVLMDVQMPEMDGLDASRRICAQWPAESRPRIIAMTANAMIEDREACFAAGMDDYLAKPVRPEELGEALSRARS